MAILVCVTLPVVIFTGCNNALKNTLNIADNVDVINGKIYVQGYDWGPGVSKVIFELNCNADNINNANNIIKTSGFKRKIKSVYLSNQYGKKIDRSSKYITFEMETTFDNSGNPFSYDSDKTLHYDWCPEYMVEATIQFISNGKKKTINYMENLIDSRLCPDTDMFNISDKLSGKYKNPMTGRKENITLHYKAYNPDILKKDKVKHPLLIWLHGQGEGGVDPDIALLGNKVVALAKTHIQNYFTTKDGQNGSYLLVVQTPTYWMDGGDGQNSNGDVNSRYTEILKDTIQKYINSNPDIDTNRIYIGGCSNGGYMTIEMLVAYPDYWAAAYPCCEAYAFKTFARDKTGKYITEQIKGTKQFKYKETDERWFTDEKIKKIKDIPIWFIQASNDSIINPSEFAMPAYRELLKAGNQNAWFSFFENVVGHDGKKTDYMGHLSWIYIFNDQVTHVQNRENILNSTDDKIFGFKPSNAGGGGEYAHDKKTLYHNIFKWLNAQSK
ncbi:MAG: prolyl oligopeptidase family serine peptidase [Firmicutes bacterium]|nr:prolyl oligopeptidase family serine peptidase [Bacillota bacterium]